MKQTLEALTTSRYPLILNQDGSGQANFFGVSIQTLGDKTMKLRGKFYELALDKHKAPASTGYSRWMLKKDGDFLMMKNFQNDLGCTGIGHKSSKRKHFLNWKTH